MITTRTEPAILTSEVEMLRKLSGLDSNQLVWHRLEQSPLPPLNLDEWAGVILCGSPFDSLAPIEKKSDVQLRVEAELQDLMDQLVAKDFPFLGICYGVGTLLGHQGGKISEKYGESISAPVIELTQQGREDPITRGIPNTFRAYVGHKEACEQLPESATLLARGEACPIQLFKVKQNMYGTQFHPELDWPALKLRIIGYAASGYYQPDDQQRIIDQCIDVDVAPGHKIISNFVDMYAR